MRNLYIRSFEDLNEVGVRATIYSKLEDQSFEDLNEVGVRATIYSKLEDQIFNKTPAFRGCHI